MSRNNKPTYQLLACTVKNSFLYVENLELHSQVALCRFLSEGPHLHEPEGYSQKKIRVSMRNRPFQNHGLHTPSNKIVRQCFLMLRRLWGHFKAETSNEVVVAKSILFLHFNLISRIVQQVSRGHILGWCVMNWLIHSRDDIQLWFPSSTAKTMHGHACRM